jgi:hypothetical protein
MLTNSIILTISKCDTLRPLGILFSPSQILYVALNIINGVVLKCNSWEDYLLKLKYSQMWVTTALECSMAASVIDGMLNRHITPAK